MEDLRCLAISHMIKPSISLHRTPSTQLSSTWKQQQEYWIIYIVKCKVQYSSGGKFLIFCLQKQTKANNLLKPILSLICIGACPFNLMINTWHKSPQIFCVIFKIFSAKFMCRRKNYWYLYRLIDIATCQCNLPWHKWVVSVILNTIIRRFVLNCLTISAQNNITLSSQLNLNF